MTPVLPWMLNLTLTAVPVATDFIVATHNSKSYEYLYMVCYKILIYKQGAIFFISVEQIYKNVQHACHNLTSNQGSREARVTDNEKYR